MVTHSDNIRKIISKKPNKQTDRFPPYMLSHETISPFPQGNRMLFFFWFLAGIANFGYFKNSGITFNTFGM